jgi:hypothetical protein
VAAKIGTGSVSFRLGAVTPQSLYRGATAVWTSAPPPPPPYIPTDSDAAMYIAAVEAADAAALENGVRQAIDEFVIGLKADSLWTPIVHATLLMGPRTLAGALVPLKGTAATNNNFVSADYDRGGLSGDAATKYIDTNVGNDSLPQNNFHMSAYINNYGGSGSIMGLTAASGGSSSLGHTGTQTRWRCRNASDFARSGSWRDLIGVSRTSSAGFSVMRGASIEATNTIASVAPASGNIYVMRSNGGSYATVNARIRWYSIGTGIPNWSPFRARINALWSAIIVALDLNEELPNSHL